MTYWGIVGLGSIAQHFVKDLALVPSANLYAVASRSEEKAVDFALAHRADVSYGNYESLFKDPKVNIVYIATPHSSHAKWSLAAMKAGKHVLCEKPLGMNLEEVQQMTQYAKKQGVFFMEALWTRFNPSIVDIFSKIRNNEIGAIQYLQADFGFYAMDKDPQSRVLNVALGGGSLLDIGIYPIFLAYLILGMPERVMASSNYAAQGTEVQTAMIFDYENAKAVLYSGFTSKSSMVAQISGKNGLITIDSRWHEAQGYKVEQNNEINSYKLPTKGRGYVHEIKAVQQAIASGLLEHPDWTHQNSLDLASLLDQVQKLTKRT
jgi:predicted dehydrogenase